MLADHFRAMARNNAWSNHRLLAACGRLSPEAYLAPRIGFFPSIHLTLNHILIVDWYYIDALEAGGLGPRAYEDETPCADLAALETAQREADRRLIREIRLFDVYAGTGIPAGHKSLAIAVRLQAADRTLTETEIDSVAERIVAAAGKATGAVLRQ